jgi:hypothetical protein
VGAVLNRVYLYNGGCPDKPGYKQKPFPPAIDHGLKDNEFCVTFKRSLSHLEVSASQAIEFVKH